LPDAAHPEPHRAAPPPPRASSSLPGPSDAGSKDCPPPTPASRRALHAPPRGAASARPAPQPSAPSPLPRAPPLTTPGGRTRPLTIAPITTDHNHRRIPAGEPNFPGDEHLGIPHGPLYIGKKDVKRAAPATREPRGSHAEREPAAPDRPARTVPGNR